MILKYLLVSKEWKIFKLQKKNKHNQYIVEFFQKENQELETKMTKLQNDGFQMITEQIEERIRVLEKEESLSKNPILNLLGVPKRNNGIFIEQWKQTQDELPHTIQTVIAREIGLLKNKIKRNTEDIQDLLKEIEANHEKIAALQNRKV